MTRAAFPLLLLAACAPSGESAAPPPEPVPATAPASAPTPGFLARQQKTESLTCLPELPAGAEDALRAVGDAAARGDLQALSGWLGGEPGDLSDLGVAELRKDPRLLPALAEVLDRGCLADPAGALVTCPPEPAGWQAGFARRGPGWRLVFFRKGFRKGD